jgi:hypothetical protein
MSNELLIELLQKLDGKAHIYNELNLYATGRQPLAFLSPESKKALGNRFGRIASNIPKLAVTSLAERLRVSGFHGADVWDDFLRSDLDQLGPIVHREALTLGQSFAIVWATAQGNPVVTVESAEQVAVKRDPVTRQVIAAVKRVRTKTTTEAWLYLPDSVAHYRANSSGASTAGFNLVETLDNPLGVVPVIPFTNTDRLLDEDGISEIEDLKPLVDGLNKALADMAVALEYSARPRRWATGIELTERPVLDGEGIPVLEDGEPVMEVVNPIPEGNRAMISEAADARFGQLDGADLQGFRTAIDVFLSQIMAVSALPSHYVGILANQPASADALRASEASLTARAEARQLTFGRSWEAVARLMYAIRRGIDPDGVTVRVVWADASTRSVAQEADAAVKLFQAALLSRESTLTRLGMTSDEIETEMDRAATDAALATDIKFGRYMTEMTTS